MENLKDNKVISVSELTHSIKTILEMQYRFVHIRGEVSNLRMPYSGHVYFTLKDSKSQIKAVLFKGQRKYLQKELREGQEIICHGRISVYEPRGEYQIIIDTVDFSGTGGLHLEFERLKRKLKNEGLFDQERKKKTPALPEKIILITSPTGAAIHDFLKIASNRNYFGSILIIPVPVQGKDAAGEISRAITKANTCFDADMLVLLRGGGSLEDLWCFNEEEIAHAISSSTMPVVTGVGHDIDHTIADMCADLHTHTPTAAAEAVIPDSCLLLNGIESCKQKLQLSINGKIKSHQKEVATFLRIIGDLDMYISHFSLQVDHQFSRLAVKMSEKINTAAKELADALNNLRNKSPEVRLSVQQERIKSLKKELQVNMKYLLERKQEQFHKQVALMDSVSPLSVLSRGYSIVTGDNGRVISKSTQVDEGDKVDIRLASGELVCEVLQKKEGEQ